MVHSHAGDDWRKCRDHVQQALGLSAWQPPRKQSAQSRPIHSTAPSNDTSEQTSVALHLWNEAHDPRNTPASVDLASRGLTLTDDVAGEVIRFHPKLKH